jgi:hypothetical protein
MLRRVALLIPLAASCVRNEAPASPHPVPALYDSCAEEVIRHDSTKPVSRCQVVPIDVASRAVVRYTGVERSPEAVTRARVSVAPEGGAYDVERTAAGWDVRVPGGAPLPADVVGEASRIGALAAPVVGWPGQAVAAHRPAAGQDVPELEEPVKRIVDLQRQGEPVVATVRVRSRGARSERWGDALVFELAMDGALSSAGMCHRWTSEVHATGELVLRASDGAVVALRLRGPLSDAEALCPEGAKQSGVSAEPKTCNRGEMSFELRWMCSET